MIMLVDVGNSDVKWAYWQPDQAIGDIRIHGRMPTGSFDVKTMLDSQAPEKILIANVAGEKIKNQMMQDFSELVAAPLHFLKTQNHVFGLHLAYTDVTSLGVDRWLAMIASTQWAQENRLVADMGTAMTVDLVDKQGQHQGGVIIPGSDALRQALLENTHDVDTAAEPSHLSLGRSTRQCVSIGVEIAQCGALEYLYRNVALKLDGGARCILTGGHATRIKPRLTMPSTHVEALVLQGLAMFAREL